MSTAEAKPAPYSRLAVAGFLLAPGSFAVGLVDRSAGLAAAMLAFALAIWARRRIKRSPQQRRGRGLATWGIALASASGIVFLGIAPALDRVRDAAHRMNSV